MAQWIDVFQNSSFVNLLQLPFLCEKTGAVALVQSGFMAGSPAFQQTKCYYIYSDF